MCVFDLQILTAAVSCLHPTQVLRCYDNRCRDTDRSPTVYLNTEVFPDERKCVEVFRIFDVCTSARRYRKFGEHHGVDENKLIWKRDGVTWMLATQYMEGNHEARTPGDFLPIIDELTELHENGIVHGDIRVYNMVFSRASDGEEPDGCLIDFDYGGTEGEAKYPSGYVGFLPDGTRRGEAGQVITKENDWIDLANIIFQHHRLNEPDGKSPGDSANMMSTEKYLARKFRKGQLKLPDHAEELRKCLEDMNTEGWTIEPSDSLRKVLDMNQSRATGSPPRAPHQN